jgi:CheY-like chemotaxis protein
MSEVYKGFSIILVEDDLVDVMSIRRAFDKNKIQNPVIVLRDGLEALEYLKKGSLDGRGWNHQPPGLIILDLNLPRMNGYELLEELKKDYRLKTIPVVVLSTSDDQSDINTCFQGGAAGYMIKPVQFDRLVDTLAAVDRYWNTSRMPEGI